MATAMYPNYHEASGNEEALNVYTRGPSAYDPYTHRNLDLGYNLVIARGPKETLLQGSEGIHGSGKHSV